METLQTSQKPVKRNYIPITEKINLLLKAERVVKLEKAMSMKAFCREEGIQPSQMRRWGKNLKIMKQSLDITTKKSKKLTCQPGRPSRLEKLRKTLLPCVASLRKEEKTVSVRMVAIRAKKLDVSLRRMKRYTLFPIS